VSDRLRFTRQIRLPEIGEAGQARLAAAKVALSARDADAQAIELGYLAAAGVTVIEGERSLDVDVGALGLTDPAARAVAEGALRALVTMKDILGT
jgi:hypothetical protein